MGGLKAPGTNGVPAVFFQNPWEVVGQDVTEAIRYFFRSRYMLHEWNHTLKFNSKGGMSK